MIVCQDGHIFKPKWYDWISPFGFECHVKGCERPLFFIEITNSEEVGEE